jgi:colanic acid/amylovoran biosynthesis protein
MSRTILINNVYSYLEKGDTAIVEAMMGYVREVCPGARIVLLSNFWQENEEYYAKAGAEVGPHAWDIPMDDAKLRRAFTAVKTLASLGLQTMRIPGLNTRTMDLYRKADAVFDVGGGSLYSSNKHRFSLGLYQHLFNLWFAKKLGKPVIIAPQSLGPFNGKRDASLTAGVLRKLDCVMIRERFSAEFLSERGVNHVLVPDIAFLDNFVKPPSAEATRYRESLPNKDKFFRVGVTVMDWRFAKAGMMHSAEGETRLSNYLNAIAFGLQKLNEMRPVHVSIVPQVIVGFGDNDLSVSRRLASMLEGKVASQSIADGDLTASDLCNIYGDMHAFVASRMHSAIFAVNRGVPTMALAYQPKTIGTFELLGLSDYTNEVMEVTGEDIAACLTKVATNYDVEKARFVAAAADAKAKLRAGLDRAWKPILSAEENSANAWAGRGLAATTVGASGSV